MYWLPDTLCDKVFQWLATGPWFSLGTPVSSTNETDRHDIIEILLKVKLNTITIHGLLDKKLGIHIPDDTYERGNPGQSNRSVLCVFGISAKDEELDIP